MGHYFFYFLLYFHVLKHHLRLAVVLLSVLSCIELTCFLLLPGCKILVLLLFLLLSWLSTFAFFVNFFKLSSSLSLEDSFLFFCSLLFFEGCLSCLFFFHFLYFLELFHLVLNGSLIFDLGLLVSPLIIKPEGPHHSSNLRQVNTSKEIISNPDELICSNVYIPSGLRDVVVSLRFFYLFLWCNLKPVIPWFDEVFRPKEGSF